MSKSPPPVPDPEPASCVTFGSDATGDVVTITIAEAAWCRHCPDIAKLCHAAVQATRRSSLTGARNRRGEIGLTMADDRVMRELNLRYRGIDRPTNVLAFEAGPQPAQGVPRLVGDLILGLQTVLEESTGQGLPLHHHVQHLVVHGCLHLLGFDHDCDRTAREMEALEVGILGALGVPDPYETEAAECAGLTMGGPS